MHAVLRPQEQREEQETEETTAAKDKLGQRHALVPRLHDRSRSMGAPSGSILAETHTITGQLTVME